IGSRLGPRDRDRAVRPARRASRRGRSVRAPKARSVARRRDVRHTCPTARRRTSYRTTRGLYRSPYPGGTMTATLSPSDLGELKTKQQATWASGNYAVIGTTLQIMGESVCEAVDIAAGSKVLDVAAGNGNASLAAARRGADVTCTDYVDDLLGLAQRRAEADGLHITTQVADAENLPFEDNTFDTVLSTVGVMFAPNPERSAAELIRVCRPGGKIGLANWTPEGFVGQMF